MKYTIYKTNTNLGNLRWWRNYDANHRNLPDIDIETYLTNHSITWVELKNTRNEAIKYEPISKDSFDSIELYLPNMEDAPDYIKITYTKADSSQESLYYYLDTVPSLFNAVNRLNAIVRYTLDKYVGFYKFHAYLKQDSVNPQMFFVRKHHPRMLGTSHYYFDCNLQPWYKENAEEKQLLVKEKLELSSTDLFNHMAQSHSIPSNFFSRNYSSDNTKAFISSTAYQTFYTYSSTIVKINDSIFTQIHDDDDYYEYIITKPYLKGSTKVPSKFVDKYFYWPIAPVSYTDVYTDEYFGRDNTKEKLWDNLTAIFTNDNIVGRVITNTPPCVLYIKDVPYLSTVSSANVDMANILYSEKITSGSNTYNFGAIICDGLPNNMKLPTNQFASSIRLCCNNFNINNDYSKTPENNPHLLAPQNWQLTYQATSNNIITLTSDYISLLTSTNLDVSLDYIFSTEIHAKFNPYALNSKKILSQACNELTTGLARQAPIESTAWNNTWIQRQTLDTSRNATIKKDTTALIIGYIMTAIGGAVASIFSGGIGAAGIMAALGGIGSMVSGGVNLSNGLAQNEQARKALYEQPNTINNPTGISGLASVDNKSINLYTMGLSDNDIQIINSDDNMYGYKITSWLPYSNYLTCWDGNYMLCDMSKNYNNIFSKLKSIDSLWTLSDNYINQFIDALNNGITWFDNGNYIDLATDEYNWERTFTRHA